MLNNFFGQPVNFMLSSTLIFLFGITVTSVVLTDQGMPNPLNALGGGIAMTVLIAFYGPDAMTRDTLAS